MALVAALGLLVLGAALLAGSAVASLELRRGTRARTASARAQSEVRRGLGVVLQQWEAALDSLPVGGHVERPLPPSTGDDQGVVVRATVWRLTNRLYAATAAVAVGPEGAVLARRRAMLVLERSAAADSTGAGVRVTRLRGWSVVELR